jgi:hypothetical protein
LLYYYSRYLTGDDNFDTVPEEARQALQWAWPCDTAVQANQWKQIVASVADPIEAAIAAMKEKTFQQYEKIRQDDIGMAEAAQRMGRVMADGIDELRQMGIDDDDPRVETIIEEIQVAQANVVRGQSPFDS